MTRGDFQILFGVIVMALAVCSPGLIPLWIEKLSKKPRKTKTHNFNCSLDAESFGKLLIENKSVLRRVIASMIADNHHPTRRH